MESFGVRLTQTIVMLMLVGMPLFAAEIAAISGDTITLDVGSADGVRVGMTGRITTQQSVGGTIKSFEIAQFKITAVEPSRSTATLTQVGSGWTVEPGMDLVFDQALSPPASDIGTIVIRSNISDDTAILDGRRLGSTPQTLEVPPGSYTVRVEKDGYEPAEQRVTVAAGEQKLVRATLTAVSRLPSNPMELARIGAAAYDAGRWAEAVEAYEALLTLVPGDPLAGRRITEARKSQERDLEERQAAQRRAEEDARRRGEVQARLANADYLMAQGDAMMREGEWELAAEYYRQVAEVDARYMDSGAKVALVEIEAALAARDNSTAARSYLALESAGVPPALRSRAESLKSRISFAPDPGAVADFEPLPGMRFRYIPAGEFEMGSPASEPERGSDEDQHRVTITRGYWMGETEVTQEQWRAVMGSNPSLFSSCGADCPVEQVSWNDAMKYANASSRKVGLEECYGISGNSVSFKGLSCEGYRLPTEAEWEHAARAGGRTRYAGSDSIDDVAWYDDNSGGKTHRVGQKRANAWGLHDMSGNVWEWCWDWYGDYPSGAVTDFVGPSTGSVRVWRGGGWSGGAGGCRSADRSRSYPGFSSGSLGFRLVRTAY